MGPPDPAEGALTTSEAIEQAVTAEQLRLHAHAVRGSLLAATIVVMIASWIPALRASRVEPMEALRHE